VESIKVRLGAPRNRPATPPTPIVSPRPILNLPLSEVLRSQIAMTLGHVMNIWTVGQFLNAWRHPNCQPRVAALFDSPEQARQAIATCAGWLGGRIVPIMSASCPMPWWSSDDGLAKPQAA
jgi:hypothetical protein